MKKLVALFAVLLFGCALWSCEYDDADIWNKVEDLDDRVEKLEEAVKTANTNIAALQKLVDAQQNGISITSVKKIENGYEITFSNGEKAQILNGKDGVDGQNGQNGQDGSTPNISVKKDADGIYYWTINGEWLTDPATGEKIKAQGVDGQDGHNGTDAVAPQLRVNPDTKEWEISTDNGQTWTSTGVKAEGVNGDSFFKSVDTTNPDYVVFTLADGTQFRIAREGEFGVAVEGVASLGFNYGEEKLVKVQFKNVKDYMIAKPDGWKVSLKNGEMKIIAPAQSNADAEKVGEVAIHAVAHNGASKILKINVIIGRVLTFEDEDYKGSGNMLGEKNWSGMIDNPQNNGPILYGPAGGDASGYFLYDEGNTEIMFEIAPSQYGSTQVKFWDGGHAVSNYVEMDLKKGDADHQLSVYYKDPVTGFGGHAGSKNFGIHFGAYMFADTEPASPYIPEFYFVDGMPHVVDHMYVTATTFLANVALNGNAFSSAITPDGFVALEAIGIGEDGETVTGKLTFNIMEHGRLVTDWAKWDLSGLGAVTRVKFNMKSSDVGSYGMNTPAYFAFDDIAVQMF